MKRCDGTGIGELWDVVILTSPFLACVVRGWVRVFVLFFKVRWSVLFVLFAVVVVVESVCRHGTLLQSDQLLYCLEGFLLHGL